MTKLVQSEHAKKLYSLINKQILFTQELLGLLDNEKAMLRSSAFKDHAVVMAQKTELLNQIEQTETSMKTLLASFKLPLTDQGIRSFAEHSPASFQKILIPSWEQLIEQAKECQTLNNTNGRIIFHSKQSIDRLLSVLKGHAANNIYMRDGKTNTRYETGSLAKA